MSINTYAPSDVDLLIDGYKITAWESIKIKRDVPSYTFVKGIRGKNTRIRTFNTSAILEISLLQTSQTNDIFSEIHKQDIAADDIDRATTADCARLVVSLKDKSGTSAFQSEDAYIVGYPELDFAQDFSTRTWAIQCLTTNIFKVGGNLKPTTDLIESIFNRR